jgi:ABC-type transporter Mla subunit MlaD
MRDIVGWVVRGGRHTRAALDDHAGAIQQLQAHVEAVGRSTDADAVGEQVRRLADDLGDRLAAIATRIDAIESRLDGLDEAVDEIVRVLAPDRPEGQGTRSRSGSGG